ncbi:MAG: hypothetical protein JWN40_4526 [Phycisphaerales bacterium]|nr:hypothetical protein [Phycisphaerales bacterium]
MLDLKDVFMAAWSRTKPLLDADPGERNRRLARRATARLQRPLREWCIALRANDLRITPFHVAIVPEHAPARLEPHRVHLTAALCRDLCHPIDSGVPCTTLKEFAQSLGVQPAVVLAQAKRGQLDLTRFKGYQHKNDRWGGIPFVSTARKPRDPNFLNRHQGPDPVWGTWWHGLARAVPATFEQVVDRIPEWHTDVTASKLQTAYPSDQNDSIIFDESPAAPRPPAPDPGVPRRFWGWRWRCPGCRETCRLLFLPTPIPLPGCIKDYLKRHLSQDDRDATQPLPTFACAKCHKVRGGISWAAKDAWNHVITQISAGLLYGHEVEVPKWLPRQRKFTAPRRPQNRPSPKREQVEQLLLRDLTYPQIARELGISEKTVCYHTMAARKAHKVQTRQQLIQKLKALRTASQPRSA